jgi:hypothetical protein
MSEEICSANPNDTRCSCYNIINRDCDANPDIPGCKESNAWRDSLVDAIPDKEEFKGQKDIAVREIQSRYHCGNRACSDDKYLPPEYYDLIDVGRCDFQLNICASDVNVGESIDTKYFRDCSINEVAFQDLDSVYAQDVSVQAILGLRTGENAALIAAKNKKLQLEIRADEREKEAERQASADAGQLARLDAIEEVRQAQQEKKENRNRLILILAAVAILLVLAILNV